MRHLLLATIAAVVLLAPTGGEKTGDPVVDKINTIRAEYNLPQLSINSVLSLSAQAKACDLRDRGYWAHISPDGETPFALMNRFGYDYRYAGENLARRCKELTCVDLWMKSPSHRYNILRSSYRDIGVGRCGEFTVIHLGAL